MKRNVISVKSPLAPNNALFNVTRKKAATEEDMQGKNERRCSQHSTITMTMEIYISLLLHSCWLGWAKTNWHKFRRLPLLPNQTINWIALSLSLSGSLFSFWRSHTHTLTRAHEKQFKLLKTLERVKMRAHKRVEKWKLQTKGSAWRNITLIFAHSSVSCASAHKRSFNLDALSPSHLMLTSIANNSHKIERNEKALLLWGL